MEIGRLILCTWLVVSVAAIPTRPQTPTVAPPSSNGLKVAGGTTFFAKLLTPIAFNKAKNEDAVEAQTIQDLKQGHDVQLKKGANLIGRIQSIQPPSANDPDTSVLIGFDRVKLKSGEEAQFNLIVQALAPESDLETDTVSPGTGGNMENATRNAGISGHSSATRGDINRLTLASTGVYDVPGLQLGDKTSGGKHYTLLVASRKDTTLKKGSQLVMKVVEVSAAQTLTSQNAQPPSTASPTSPRIAFARNMIFPQVVIGAPTPTNIFVSSTAEDTKESQLTKDDRSLYPVWSPDGKRIAYLHFDESRGGPKPRRTEVVLMDADGENRRHLAFFQFGREPTLSWSRDNKTLAIGGVILGASMDGEGFVESSIYLLDTSTGKSPLLLIERGFAPSWSPDGKLLAYTCTAEMKPGEYKLSICVVPATTHAEPRLLVENARRPRWSPNGERIAYLSRNVDKWRLILCQPDGSERVALTDLDRDVHSFAWSPDGKRIAYTEKHAMEDGGLPVDVPRIFVVKLDGTKTGPYGEKDRLWCHDLSWSFDGKFIAAICSSGLRDRVTRKERVEASLFLLDSADVDVPPRVIARDGVENAIFGPMR